MLLFNEPNVRISILVKYDFDQNVKYFTYEFKSVRIWELLGVSKVIWGKGRVVLCLCVKFETSMRNFAIFEFRNIAK
ncbi:MAG: hypothetical protein CSA03_02075 [Bacteroidetes bacterium]|nr:MAG: hypothetical protein CSA03_02075 [Bacteroidota bacterium]